MIQAMAVAVCLAGPLVAQAPLGKRMVPAIHLVNKPVQEVLVHILSGAKAKYLIGTEVQGRISVDLPKMSLRSALWYVCSASNLVYSHDQTQDCFTFRQAIGLNVPGSADADLKIKGDPTDRLIRNFKQIDRDVHEIADKLFGLVKVHYTFSSDVHGYLSCDLPPTRWEICLRWILNNVGGTYRAQGGIYMLIKREIAVPGVVVKPPKTKG